MVIRMDEDAEDSEIAQKTDTPRKRRRRRRKRRSGGGSDVGLPSRSQQLRQQSDSCEESDGCSTSSAKRPKAISSNNPSTSVISTTSLQSDQMRPQADARLLDLSVCRDLVQEWYPHLNSGRHFLPALFMNRTHHRDALFGGQRVAVIDEPSEKPHQSAAEVVLEKDVRSDQAVKCVINCIRKLPEEEVMFVISELKFHKYLINSTESGIKFDKDGDFDILIIHRQFGILVGEVKATGQNFTQLCLSEEKREEIVAGRLTKATKQLQKARGVLKQLMPCDLAEPRIQTTLMFPFITRQLLCNTLASRADLRQELSECLSIPFTAELVPFCMTAEDMNTPGRWWQARMLDAGTDPAMSADVYLDLVSRFAGPATTVEVPCSTLPRLASTQHRNLRTLGDGVMETANRFAPAVLVLHPEQVHVLNSGEGLVYISGPPGTGKSIVLFLKALQWLLEGHSVLLLSTSAHSLAVSYMIRKQVQEATSPETCQRLLLRHVNIKQSDNVRHGSVEEAVTSFEGLSLQQQLYVIADETFGRQLAQLVSKLKQRVPQLHLWASSVHQDLPLRDMAHHRLSAPLRSPPSVTTLIQSSGYVNQGIVDRYSPAHTWLPSTGPTVLHVRHSGPGHSNAATYLCWQCGKEVAWMLKETLRVGVTEKHPDDCSGRPPALRFRHVFLLTSPAHPFHDGQSHPDSGRTAGSASGFIQGVREAGVPVVVLEPDDQRAVEEVATMSGSGDEAVAADCETVSGLERPVVVWLQGDQETTDESVGRLKAMSRSTAQLLWVKRPP